MPLLRTYKRFDETTFFRYTVNWFSRKTEKGRSVFLEQCCITRTSSIKAKDKIVCNGSPLNTEGLTDTAMKSMYNFSVMIPAILFLSVFLLFRIKYSLGKTEIDALQVEKGKLMEKAGK